MNVVAQLIDQKTGQRTPPVSRTREDLAVALKTLYNAQLADKTYVLILADDSVEPGSLDFALAPLMTVSTFIEHFAPKDDLLKTTKGKK